jgi:hypothetical protein
MPAVSEKQRRFMEMCLHSPRHAEGECPDHKVAEEFSHKPLALKKSRGFKIGTTHPASMSASEINKERDGLESHLSGLNQQMIDLGYGDKKLSEIRSMDHPVAHQMRIHLDRDYALRSEIRERMGPSHTERLPVGRGGFGPRIPKVKSMALVAPHA